MNIKANNLYLTFKKQASNKRFIYVLLVGLYPVLVPGLLSASVFLLSDINKLRPIGTSSEYVSIDYPAIDSVVPNNFTIKGTIKKSKPGYSLFLTTNSNDLYWPKTELSLLQVHWNYGLTIKNGSKLNISVIAVNKDGKQRIDNWFQVGVETGKYPALSAIPGLETVAQITVEK